MNLPASACKTRWTNLRDIYRRSLKKTAEKSKRCKYKFSDELCFLNEFLSEKEYLNYAEPKEMIEELHEPMQFQPMPSVKNDLLLIQQVRNHPALYDHSRLDYKDRTSKVDIWNNIARELQTDSASCRSRWANIRSNYAKAVNRNSTRIGSKEKIYKYSDELYFLREFVDEKRTKVNFWDQQDEENNLSMDTEEHENEENTVNHAEPKVVVTELHGTLQIQPFGSVKNDSVLIQLVRDHPQLYDAAHPEYIDNNLKIVIWNKIGQELNTDGPTCKSRWNNIRCGYLRALKKNSSKYRVKPKKIYKYSDQLSFLKEHLDVIVHEESFCAQQEGENNLDDDTDVHDSEEITLNYGEETKVFASDVHGNYQIESSSSQNTNYGKVFQEILETRPLTKDEATKQRSPLRFVESSDSRSKHPVSNVAPKHFVDAFLAGISPTLKTFTPYYLNLAKSEIFEVVQKYDMLMLQNQKD